MIVGRKLTEGAKVKWKGCPCKKLRVSFYRDLD